MRISDWSSDVCSSDLQDYRRSTPCAAVGAAAAVWVKLAQAQRRGPQEGRLRPGARSCHSPRLALALARFAGLKAAMGDGAVCTPAASSPTVHGGAWCPPLAGYFVSKMRTPASPIPGNMYPFSTASSSHSLATPGLSLCVLRP